jgi:hypothetical protein
MSIHILIAQDALILVVILKLANAADIYLLRAHNVIHFGYVNSFGVGVVTHGH